MEEYFIGVPGVSFTRERGDDPRRDGAMAASAQKSGEAAELMKQGDKWCVMRMNVRERARSCVCMYVCMCVCVCVFLRRT